MRVPILNAALVLVAMTVVPALAQSQSQVRNEDLQWRYPLNEKARIIQEKIYRDHWILGTYPSQVQIYADGRPVDHGTTGYSNIAHTSSWTGSYLMGAAFRYGWAKEHGTPEDVEAALNLGGGMVNGLYLLSHVSGKPGFLARGVAYGYGPSYEERHGSDRSDAWFQGAGQHANLRFRANPSHHNYDQVTRALAFWYYFLNKYNPNPTGRVKAQMDSVRTAYRDIIEYAYKSHDLIVYDFDGTISTPLLSGFPSGSAASGRGAGPSTRTLMVTNALTYGYWIVGDRWCRDKKEELVRQFNYLGPGMAQRVRAGADDAEHTLPGLWLASQIEGNQELKEFYRAAGASLFERFRDAGWALFNYIYADLTGDAQGANLESALRTLQLFPTNSAMYPVMNSIRTDIEIEEGQEGRSAKRALPFNEIPMDNEYDWKGGPLRLDGWWARPISSLAVSGETPKVWLLSDGTNTLYHTIDGGRTFQVNDYRRDGAIREITFAGNKSRIALIATTEGIYRTSRFGDGNQWERVQLGPEGSTAVRVILDKANPNVVWALMSDGVYRSADLGRDEVGTMWERVSSPLPANWTVAYAVSTGENPVLYASTDRGFFRSTPGSRWTVAPLDRIARYGTARQIVVSPTDPNTFFTLIGRGSISLVMRSTDGGQTLAGGGPGGRSAPSGFDLSRLTRTEMTSIAVDPVAPQNVYAASPSGFFRSNDSGMTWAASNAGLRIPYLYNVHAPQQLPGTLLASTPAGLHVSTDRGQSWSAPILVLNGPGVDRLDKGGMAYLAAYWPGRYFGYVTDEQVAQPPDAWGE